jgi:hypothetical protein
MTNVDIAKKYFKDRVFKINDKIFGEYDLFVIDIENSLYPGSDEYEIIIKFEKDKFSSTKYIREVLKYHLNMFGIVNFIIYVDSSE